MLTIDKLTHLGKAIKTRGVRGEIQISINEGVSDDVFDLEVLFIEFDGLPVPFFISDEQFSPHTQTLAFVKFDDIETETQAKEFVGQDIYIEDKSLLESEGPNELIGYKIIDKNIGEIGILDEIIPIPQNELMSVIYKGDEILIPLTDEIVENINDSEKIILVNCPEGLLEINNN